MSLIDKLNEIVGSAFTACGLSAELGTVRVSDRPDLAQFQCNGAMAAAKQAKKNPRAVAEEVAAGLSGDPLFSKIEIAGPGFINLNITDEALAKHLMGIAIDDRCGVAPLAQGETVVLDYGGPNIAKAMHVGHLRASIIGDTLRRVLSFCGYKTLGDVHMGDWGTQIGMVISEMAMRHPEWPYFDPAFTGPYPEQSPFDMAELEAVYPAAAKVCKEDESRMEQARQATVELQNGRPGYRALWRHIVDVSIVSMKANFAALNVHFDLWKGEADVHDLIAPMADDLKAKGFAVIDDGALVVPVRNNDDSKEIPPLILYKRDGAVMYGTTDLATLVERMNLYKPSKIVYVVDQRQNLHFEQVFRAARLSGIAPADVELTFAGFGTMNGPDGKPFKTREGGILRLEDLIAMGRDKALARLDEAELAQDATPEERRAIAHMVGVAAIKFADLQNQRQVDYVFDLDRLTSFEGKTGPYILYQAVRIKSLLRKAGEGAAPSSLTLQDGDRKLALLMIELPEVLATVVRNYTPHVLCDYMYRLAQEFSSFYGNCHILSETDERLKRSRLQICRMALSQLELTTGLLGIDVPERM
ncbi:MAG: arginine--tRNA ligase [Micavibrio aeruginosavorus]|uniref:Arginine--tRNA ligase n=1 Tax=Micavibrio aeruginosavorus TaxID=349221 RepID=A0A7T5UI72_9BACT|nr:MAG: arginine--tRNA ligase [Micavibrio aeruginosavorus]